MNEIEKVNVEDTAIEVVETEETTGFMSKVLGAIKKHKKGLIIAGVIGGLLIGRKVLKGKSRDDEDDYEDIDDDEIEDEDDDE